MQSSRAVATPIPDVGGVRNLQQVLTNDWKMFAPSLKIIAIKNDFWKMREVGPFFKSAHM